MMKIKQSEKSHVHLHDGNDALKHSEIKAYAGISDENIKLNFVINYGIINVITIARNGGE